MEIKPQKKRILHIDMWNVCIGMNARMNIVDANSSPIGMYLGTLNMIRFLTEKFRPNKIILAFDGPEAGERRRKIYSGYKSGSRVKASTVTIQEDDDENTKFSSSEAFTKQLGMIFEFCKLLPVTTVIVPYCEGDDIIAYLSLKNKDHYDNIIVSNDKDYCQLIQEGIRVYNWHEKILYNATAFFDKFKIIPENYIYMKILLGDISDKVKGVKGIGKKTFPIFHDILNEKIYHDVGEFVEGSKKIDINALDTRKKNALTNMFEESSVENMFLLFQVMKLDENCLKLHHIETLRQQIDEQNSKSLSKIMSYAVMKRNYFNKLHDNFNPDKWIQSFAFVRPNEKIQY